MHTQKRAQRAQRTECHISERCAQEEHGEELAGFESGNTEPEPMYSYT